MCSFWKSFKHLVQILQGRYTCHASITSTSEKMCRMQVKSWLELLQILPKDTQLFSVPIRKNTASQPALLSLQGNVIKLGINSFCATTASFLINTLVPKKKEKKSKKCCGWVHRLIKRIIGFKLSQELCSLISKGEKKYAIKMI